MHNTLLFPVLLLFATTTAYASPATPSADNTWYAYIQGTCMEKSPMELMVVAQLSRLRVETNDIEENGQAISTAVTVIGNMPWERETVVFYRGKARCETAQRADNKRFQENVDRYR